MNEIAVRFSNKKRIQTLLIGVAIILCSAGFMYYQLFVADRIKIFFMAFDILLLFGGFFMLIGGLRNILNKEENGLILNATGVITKTTPIGKRAGLVEWQDVGFLSETKQNGLKFICLNIPDRQKYAMRISSSMMRKVFMDSGCINISNDELDITYIELKMLLEEQFMKYKNRNQEIGTRN